MDTKSIAPALTLRQEIASLGDGPLEMVNLAPSETGIRGIVFISTAMGPHGPQVKYFVKAGGYQPSFSVSISAEPRVVANSLPNRDLKRASPEVVKWVRLNHGALLRFWNEGESWTHLEINDFVAGLKKLD